MKHLELSSARPCLAVGFVTPTADDLNRIRAAVFEGAIDVGILISLPDEMPTAATTDRAHACRTRSATFATAKPKTSRSSCSASSTMGPARRWRSRRRSDRHEAPRLKILTVEELLAGKRIDMPAQQDVRSFKQAPKAKGRKQADEAKLF